MKQIQKHAALVLAALLVLTGCSMGNDENDQHANMQGKANQSETNPPQNNNMENDTMDQMISYLNDSGVTLNQMQTLDQMDFAAHEGRSFSYQGNSGYLYRLKSNDASMRALLDSAAQNGTVKVNMDGSEKDYKAAVNGDYLFVYDQSADMQDLIKIFTAYTPGMRITNKESDEQDMQDDAKRSEKGNADPINGGNASEFNDADQIHDKNKNSNINGSESTTNNNTANGINHTNEED